jgi:arylsulfatase
MNVILVVIDTLRAKNMSCYGYGKKTCPNIDGMASEGVLFVNSFGHANNTHPAFTTIFAGMYPVTHRVVRMNGQYYLNYDKIRMVTELIRDAGYATLAVDNLASTGRFVKADWLMRGFDVYVNYAEVSRREKRRIRRLFEVNDLAFPLLEDVKGKPFFMFIHSWDTHTPYNPRQEFKHIWYDGDPTSRLNLGADGRRTVEKKPTGRTTPSMKQPDPQDVKYTIAQYDATISDADAALGDLMSKLEELDIAEDTMVIVTSDHGENLGEHEMFFNHRWPYDDCIYVPIIFWSPKYIPQGRRIEAIAQHVDLAPTILGFLGIQDTVAMEGHNLVDAIIGRADDTYKYARMHATYPDVRRAIRTKEYRFIKTIPGCPYEPDWPKRELYDMRADPNEVANVIESASDISAQLEAEMDRWVAGKLAQQPGWLDPLIEQSRHGWLPYEN